MLTLGTLAREWMLARGRQRRILHLPAPGAFAAALRQGRNTTSPDPGYGRITWADWLRKTYAPHALAAA
ncbi:MAG: hypothetical protein ABI901_11535 [Roseiflexaceae bacterium]